MPDAVFHCTALKSTRKHVSAQHGEKEIIFPPTRCYQHNRQRINEKILFSSFLSSSGPEKSPTESTTRSSRDETFQSRNKRAAEPRPAEIPGEPFMFTDSTNFFSFRRGIPFPGSVYTCIALRRFICSIRRVR